MNSEMTGIKRKTRYALDFNVHRPSGSKVFVPRNVEPQYTRGKVGESLYMPQPEFTFKDPEIKVMKATYNPLHDPHLKAFFQQPSRQKALQINGLINNKNDVLCTAQDLNCYMGYLHHYGWTEKNINSEETEPLTVSDDGFKELKHDDIEKSSNEDEEIQTSIIPSRSETADVRECEETICSIEDHVQEVMMEPKHMEIVQKSKDHAQDFIKEVIEMKEQVQDSVDSVDERIHTEVRHMESVSSEQNQKKKKGEQAVLKTMWKKLRRYRTTQKKHP